MDSLDDLALSLVLAFLPLVDLVSCGFCSRRLCEAVQQASEAWRRLADELPPVPEGGERESGAAAAAAPRVATTATPLTTPTPTTTATRTPLPSAPPPAQRPPTHAPGRWRPHPPCAAALDCRLRVLQRRRAARARRQLELLRRQSDAASAERAVRALTQEAAAEGHARLRVAREAAAIADDLRVAEAAAASAGGGGSSGGGNGGGGSVRAWVPSGVRAGWEAAAAGAGASGRGSGGPSVVAVRGVDARVRLRQLAQEAAVSDARAETLALSLRAARQSLTRARRALKEAADAEERGGQGAGAGAGGGGGGGGGGVVRVCPTPLLL